MPLLGQARGPGAAATSLPIARASHGMYSIADLA